MIYEWREYHAVPGKEAELLARFQDDTFTLFDQHGIKVNGFWVAKDDPGRLLYMCEFRDEDHRNAAWAAFQADAVWKEVKQNSEKEGSLTDSLTSLLLMPLPREAGQ